MPSPTTDRMLQPRDDVDVLDLAAVQFRVERVTNRASRSLGLDLRNREADRMLGAPLRNEDDRDAILAKRAEQPLRRAGHADHAGALQVDERHGVDAGDALDGVNRVRRFAR